MIWSAATYDAAITWCDRLAQDRGQVAWSIRLTREVIAASLATRLAWQTYLVARQHIKEVSGELDVPPRVAWAEAAKQLRSRRPQSRQPKPQPPPPPKPPKPPAVTATREDRRMAKKQTRRSISVSKKTYDQARAFADDQGLSLSQLTETALQRVFDHFQEHGRLPP